MDPALRKMSSLSPSCTLISPENTLHFPSVYLFFTNITGRAGNNFGAFFEFIIQGKTAFVWVPTKN